MPASALQPAQTDAIARVFEEAGCAGQLCVQSGSEEREVALDADSQVVAASVIKVLIAVEAERQFTGGTLDPEQRVRLPAATRTPGPSGFSIYSDDVETSVRDLLVAMLTISDNVATDALLDLTGLDACNATAAALGMTQTVIASDLRTMIDGLAHAAGLQSWPELAAELARADPERRAQLRDRLHTCEALDPRRATRTTPRDMCRLLRAIWTDRATDPQACERLRGLMGRQLTRHRLATGFGPQLRVAAKSGGLIGVVRNEIGVIEFPDGGWYAAAVFTQATSEAAGDEAIDGAIGEASARAVSLLRSSRAL